MSNEQAQPKTGFNPLKEALTPQQLASLTEGQWNLLERGVVRLAQKHGIEGITPAMIQGQYELVTEHLLPTDVEAIYKS